MKHVLKNKSFRFSVKIIEFSSKLPNKKQYWIISDQLIRSSTSIGANVHEATSASTRKEFIRFYQIALRSTYETSYWLNLIYAINQNLNHEVKVLINDMIEIKKVLTASILSLKKRKE